jgi:putative heme iron utilization protein
MTQTRDDGFEPVRQLWAGRFQGVISTQSQAEPGYPFGSLVPYCLDRAGRPVFLFSHLAQHAKNLAADPRCALTLAEPVPGDIQQGQRLTCIGECRPLDPSEADSLERYLRYFPDGRIYAERLNFRPYRLEPRRFHYNGGFAAARWLGCERVLRSNPLDGEAEASLADALIRNQGPQLAALLPAPEGAPAGPSTRQRIAGIDPWGLDLGWGDRLRRVPFPEAMTDARAIAAYVAGLGT